jgi:GDP-mannose 6-dehydrogenase
MKISIFGLGYVGTVCGACLAREGHTIIGVDVDASKVAAINSGLSPVVEPELNSLIQKGAELQRFNATISAADAVHNSEISLVCVGTPSLANGSPNFTYLERVCKEIGLALRTKRTSHVVALRSTMLPGTTEDRLIPILEKHSGKRAGEEFGVCYNPEFLREGSSVHDFFKPPRIVIGENDERNGDLLLQLYKAVKAPIIRTSIRAAEMVKYTDNAFHALKITFANEVGNLCKKMEVDSYEVMSVFCQDIKLDLAPTYLKPGFAFGGSCLPKDLRALAYQAKMFDIESPLLNAILESNRVQMQLGIQKILALGRKRVGFLGMAFKPDTDDLRESPLVELIETLLGKGYSISIFDRNVSLSRLVGANRQFIDERIPHLSSLLVDRIEDLVDKAEVVVVGHNSPEFIPALQRMRQDQMIIDLARIGKLDGLAASYDGICW